MKTVISKQAVGPDRNQARLQPTRASPCDQHPPSRFQFLRDPQPSKAATIVRNGVFKHMTLWRTFYIQTIMQLSIQILRRSEDSGKMTSGCLFCRHLNSGSLLITWGQPVSGEVLKSTATSDTMLYEGLVRFPWRLWFSYVA